MDAEAKVLYRRGSVRPDLYWPGARMDVEYDGDVHEGDESRISDAGRRAALEALGTTVLVLTYAQVADDPAFDVLARRIGKAIGAPVRIRMKDGKHDERRAALRRELELTQ